MAKVVVYTNDGHKVREFHIPAVDSWGQWLERDLRALIDSLQEAIDHDYKQHRKG